MAPPESTPGVTSGLRLADFPPASPETWMDLVDDVLRGAPFEKKLVSQGAAGIPIQPLYDREFELDAHGRSFPGFADHTRGSEAARMGAQWDIRQRHNLIDPAVTNAEILDDLENGATSILLRVFGEVDVDDLRSALAGVYLDLAPVALDAGPWVDSAAAALDQVYADQGIVDASARLGARRTDPLGALARFGTAGRSSLGAIASGLQRMGEYETLIGVDATPYSDAGADAAQEIAWSLATAVSYLREMVGDHGWSVDDVARATEFTYAATADQFTTIAKFRAARRCWSRVLSAAGGQPKGQRQRAVTHEAMFTRRDPWVNLLRSSTACFAAAAGGAESITVLPFDTALGRPTEVGRRTARNIQLLLQEESHLGQVIDPAGGSWFVEDYTDRLAEAAWSEFQEVERVGGMFAALTGEHVRSRLLVTTGNRTEQLRNRREAITGVSEFATLDHDALEREPWPSTPSMGLVTYRPADEYEALRDQADAAAQRPTVLLINLGTVADHTARATFATNFAAAGGIAVETSTVETGAGIIDADGAVARWKLSPQPVAIICGTDEQYAALVASVASALKTAGCGQVIVAGNPGANRAGYKQAGVDGFIHIGVDVIAALRSLHNGLEVAQ